MLQFEFAYTQDENGVYNGLELAGDMIGQAAFLIAPYVRNCPGCIDKLFSVLANRALEEFHKEVRADEVQPSFMAAQNKLADPDAACHAHFNAFRPLVRSLIGDEDEGHAN